MALRDGADGMMPPPPRNAGPAVKPAVASPPLLPSGLAVDDDEDKAAAAAAADTLATVVVVTAVAVQVAPPGDGDGAVTFVFGVFLHDEDMDLSLPDTGDEGLSLV